GDIAPLARSIVAQFRRQLGKGKLSLGAEALAALEAFPWPGNIRQLQNVIQQAVLLGAGLELGWRDFPLPIRESLAPPRERRRPPAAHRPPILDFPLRHISG